MSADVEAVMQAAAAASLKRKTENEGAPEAKLFKSAMPPQSAPPTTTTAHADATEEDMEDTMDVDEDGMPIIKGRTVRLEQNRKAARESRRRKKVMIEELQRSVIFFSRANGTLKQQNDELTRLLMQAQAHASVTEGGEQPPTAPPAADAKTEGENFQQAQAQAVATQAVFESQGYPAAAARAAAHTMNASTGATTAPTPAPANVPATATSTPTTLPPMQPGATMQAMANFQQAAAAAMQNAIQGMQGIPGVNMNQLAATPVGANPQQAYTDTMTALAMQQAAAAGQQFAIQPNAMHFMAPMLAWQQHAQQVAPTLATTDASASDEKQE